MLTQAIFMQRPQGLTASVKVRVLAGPAILTKSPEISGSVRLWRMSCWPAVTTRGVYDPWALGEPCNRNLGSDGGRVAPSSIHPQWLNPAPLRRQRLRYREQCGSISLPTATSTQKSGIVASFGGRESEPILAPDDPPRRLGHR
jgi:hypothetical protein